MVNWGFNDLWTVLLANSTKPHIVQIHDRWIPSPLGFLKLNFDDASKENPDNARYEFIVHDPRVDMRGFGYGSLGKDTNNAAEIEGLLQGLVWETVNFRMLIIVEGDSQLLINMAAKLQCGT